MAACSAATASNSAAGPESLRRSGSGVGSSVEVSVVDDAVDEWDDGGTDEDGVDEDGADDAVVDSAVVPWGGPGSGPWGVFGCGVGGFGVVVASPPSAGPL
jgi:hypothetical protein